MFGRLLKKELASHLLDYRFAGVFVFCAVLSVVAIGVGIQNYEHQLNEHNNTRVFGSYWSRAPEPLSPVVRGLSEALGRQVGVGFGSPNQFHQPLSHFEFSNYEANPGYALFGVLDLAFIVQIVLSLAILVFTHDAVCGEKQEGTLRLTASYPVSRSTLALAKLLGSWIAVCAALLFAFLLSATVLALSPTLQLTADHWMRIVALFGLFALYLSIFAAFGVWVSALTHHRLVSFLGLLGLWGVWLLVIPNVALHTARWMEPVTSFYDVERENHELRWELAGESYNEKLDVLREAIPGWDSLPEKERWEIYWRAKDGPPHFDIQWKWRNEYRSRSLSLETNRRNEMARQHGWVKLLSVVSPLGAVRFASMDLARTGWLQQAEIENTFGTYHNYVLDYIKAAISATSRENRPEFKKFEYRPTDSLADCLERNLPHIANLIVLALLGFVGAFVAMLRYDVR